MSNRSENNFEGDPLMSEKEIQEAMGRIHARQGMDTNLVEATAEAFGVPTDTLCKEIVSLRQEREARNRILRTWGLRASGVLLLGVDFLARLWLPNLLNASSDNSFFWGCVCFFGVILLNLAWAIAFFTMKRKEI